MPRYVRQAVDPKHAAYMREPFGVFVGGPKDGEARGLRDYDLKLGYAILDGWVYPLEEVHDSSGKRGWRIMYKQRKKRN